MSDRPKLQRREVMGQYLAVDPDLEDKEKHGLTLTQDGKLRVDDPTTQGKIDDLSDKVDVAQADLDNPDQYKADVSALALEATVEAVATALEGHHVDIRALLENAAYGLSALKTLIDAVEGKLDVPDDYKADVAALALEATLTAIKGAGWTDETLKAIVDLIDARPAERGTDNALLAASYVTERGTNNAELESSALTRYNALIAAINAITGGATAAEVWAYTTRRLTNLSDARAARIDNIEAIVDRWEYIASGTLQQKIDTEGSTVITTYSKKREIPYDPSPPEVMRESEFRIKFDLKSPTGYAYGKIYNSGVAVGTERATSSSSYVTYTEDIPDWNVDDTIELWVHGSGPTMYYRYFRIYGTLQKHVWGTPVW